MRESKTVAVLGLGYVGLPLSVAVSGHFKTVGFDINGKRVSELLGYKDRTEEVSEETLMEKLSQNLHFSHDEQDLAEANLYIITVPTPIDEFKSPDLGPLEAATKTVAKHLKPGDTVVYESTTYPGCTEEVCVPLLEQESGLAFNKDFFVGYSPERINAGDKVHTVTNITKVVSGSTPEVAQELNAFYGKFIEAGTHLAPSIKVAEAAKAIENAQRDVNISFVNELALIFDRLGIDTRDVLEAAGTKWNFLPFTPGLVGGHCISVDPYYLAHKAKTMGYHPQVILSGRQVNDAMGMHVANTLVKLMIAAGQTIKGGRVLLLGFTFKENCPDTRNTRIIDIYQELVQFGMDVDVYDPHANPEEVAAEYGISLLPKVDTAAYNSIVVAVAHNEFKDFTFDPLTQVVYDLKGILPRTMVAKRL